MTFSQLSEFIFTKKGNPRFYVCEDWKSGTVYIVTHRQHRRLFNFNKPFWWNRKPVGARFIFKSVGHARLKALTHGHQGFFDADENAFIQFHEMRKE